MSSAPRITFTRREPGDIVSRLVFVLIYGGEYSILRHGDEEVREVEPGHHLLKVHNTLFWKNIELDLQPGEHARFRIVNRPGFGTFFLGGTLGVGPIYLTVERLDRPDADAVVAAAPPRASSVDRSGDPS